MQNFWEYDVWAPIALFGTLMISLLGANILKRRVPFLRNSLIPTAVLGGLLLLIISSVYELCTDKLFFNTTYFGGNGASTLEVITYHALALGFIATAFKPSSGKHTLKRNGEIFDTGVTTVSTYLLQGVLGLGATILIALVLNDVFAASGLILPFGFGQGTGQALNWGSIYETDHGFEGGRSFGLSIAALGFLAASIGGVIHLNILKHRGAVLVHEDELSCSMSSEDIQQPDEIPMNGSMDKLSVQVGFVLGAYMAVQALLLGLSSLLPSFQSVLYGFNFLFGVLIATTIRVGCTLLRKHGIMHRQYVNGFLMDRISNFFFDLMVVAGIAAIRLEVMKGYWWIVVLLAVLGTFPTYFYNRFIARKFFPEYSEQQFLMMYGMLTGTASTGTILLRELDPQFETPAADNLVYQNFPAIVFGLPLMFLAKLAPVKPFITWLILLGFFIFLNVLLFRRQLFMRKKSKSQATK